MYLQSRNILAITLAIAFMLNTLTMTSADVDWQGACADYKCQCQWKSGKKSADCRNTSQIIVPTKLSSEIQVLDLSQNIIAELRQDEFAEANLLNVHVLLMKSCTLIEINRDAFKGLEILIELDLSNNNIKELQVGTFKTLVRLRTIYLNDNEIEKLDDMLFDSLPHLHKIDLKNNRIKKIGYNTFHNVSALSQIYLDNNNLQLLRRETFQKLNRLKTISLTHNSWNCTCELKPFRDFIIDKNLYTHHTDCKYPAELKGKYWPNILSEDFACQPKILSPRAGSVLTATSENATLSCRVRAQPSPDIDWIFNKRSLNMYDQRISIRNSKEINNKRDGGQMEISTSDLIITGIKQSDRGTYTCIAKNRGGIDESDMTLEVPHNVFHGNAIINNSSNILLITIFIATGLLLILFLIFCILCLYCKRIRNYNKNASITENGLVVKMEKTQNDSILEGGSVILEMQKSLLTEVNPVEKPPRRAEVDASDRTDYDDNADVKKTLLEDNTMNQQDEETHSLTLSDVARSRTTFVDDGYSTNLPPDLLAFSSRFPQSPSIQSSMSNVHDGRLYSKSPASSPLYQHSSNNSYSTQIPSGFRTLQHPKTGRTIAIATNRSNSPFTPAPLVYPPVILKQGYVTIPRKQPRTPSWSIAGSTADYEPSSPTSIDIVSAAEPVYDNLGLRTTASGNSILNLNKIFAANNCPIKYTMKDRPLPATPIANGNADNNSANNNINLSSNNNKKSSGLSKMYEPIENVLPSSLNGQSNNEPLYTPSRNITPKIVRGGGPKVPPKPPPKPKKLSSTGEGNISSTALLSNSQDSRFDDSNSSKFEDETEDGTEV